MDEEPKLDQIEEVEDEQFKVCYYTPTENCWTIRPSPLDDSFQELNITRGYCQLCLGAQLVRELRLLRVTGTG